MRGRFWIDTRPWRRVLGRWLRPILVWDAAIFGVVGVACLLNPAWRSWMDAANGLVLICAGVMAFGIFSSFGGWSQTGSFQYQYGSTVDGRDGYQHAQDFVRERGGALNLVFRSITISLLPLLAAAVIGRLTGNY